jgi:hypothetical protein
VVGVVSHLNPFRTIHDNRGLFIVVAAIVTITTVDVSLLRSYSFFANIDYAFNTQIFFALATTAIMLQYIVLKFIRGNVAQTVRSRRDKSSTVLRIVTLIQYCLVIVIAFATLQVLFLSHYAVITLLIATALSYGVAFAMMGLLARRFISWFRIKRDAITTLYLVFSIMLGSTAVIVLALNADVLLQIPQERGPSLGLSYAVFDGHPVRNAINVFYFIFAIGTFIVTWIATYLLLQHYSRKVGRAGYAIMVSIPLVYFLSQFFPFYLDVFEPLIRENPVMMGFFFSMIFSLSKLVGGVMFGAAFWSIARKMTHSQIIRNYLAMSACGFVLLFSSEQAILLIAPSYPPFGLITISFVGLAACMILHGIYSAAVSVSHDIELRRAILGFVNTNRAAILFDSIGEAQMEKEIQEKVMEITRDTTKSLIKQSGISPSVVDDDIKIFLKEVIEEVKKRKNPL